VAVLWALFLAALVYKKLTREQFLKSAAKAVKSTGAVLLLIGISSMFGYLIGLYGVAELTGNMLSSLSAKPWVIFLWVNIILFVLGTFLDMAATILICTPIVMLINCALGLNTPPVGTTQFVGCTIGEVSVGTVMKTIWPFYGGLIAALMLVTYVPEFSMWLPNLILK
jgi:TRAP-type C4-dicarboxylate transport system permease large subunit